MSNDDGKHGNSSSHKETEDDKMIVRECVECGLLARLEFEYDDVTRPGIRKGAATYMSNLSDVRAVRGFTSHHDHSSSPTYVLTAAPS